MSEGGTGRGDRDGDRQWSGCQPRAQHPCPYPRGSKRCLFSGDIAFPPPRFVPKSIPMRIPAQSRGAGIAWQRGWGVGWGPPGQGDTHTHTQGGGGRPHAGIAQCYLLLQKDFHKFPKPAGIVVPHGFGVAEGFQQGGRLQDLPRRWGEPGGSAWAPRYTTGCPHGRGTPLATLPSTSCPVQTPMGAKIQGVHRGRVA